MAKLDELVSERGPHAPQSGSRWSRSWLARNCDLLVLLFFVLTSTELMWLSPRALYVVRDTSLVDDNWHLHEVFKLSRGIWVGREVAFTHGPIFQWLSSLPARSMGVSMGAIYATWLTVPSCCAFVFVYLTLRLLLAGQPAWKRALLLFLVLRMWLAFLWWSFQNTFPVLLFAIFVVGWYAVTGGRAKSYTLGIIAALLCVIAFLIAPDTGVYSTAAWVIATATIFFEECRNKHLASSLVVALLAYAASGFVFALVVNAAIGRAFDFRFWKDSAQIVSVYRWATPLEMTRAGTVRLLGGLLVGAAVFLFRAGTRTKQSFSTTGRSGFLLGGFAFAVVMLQSALVRSDYWRVGTASMTMVLLAGTILFSFQSGTTSSAAVLLAIACSMMISRPALRPSSYIDAVRQVVRQFPTQCPAGFGEFDGACFPAEFTAMLQSAASYLGQHSMPQEHIVVFPYQTMFGIVAQRSVAGGLMQPYTASGSYLAQLEIAGLESAPAPTGLYLPDRDMRYLRGHSALSENDQAHWRNLALSLPIGGTYNFTRTPELWFWMLRHYRAEKALSEGIFSLLRDDSRAARISMEPQTLGLAVQTFPIRERSSVVDLGAPDWPTGADFLRLRLTVRYSFWWKLRKPESLQLEITRADGSSELRWFIMHPNLSTEIWLYPWSPSDLANYLDADENHWRTKPRPAITRLRIVATPLDWVSVAPDAIVLEAAESVRIHMRP